ncbi:hypothetical protein SSP531S_27730 [Streptomyces spongiicola]|uniref:Uncharacterized protein n=1 Tax=Streptomyces spongiicola TaxID=1690221 RepID=A0A388T013_9ACTN|nr:hypothetical protein SSP531S_27730 [Streptomyces spongiicola]
MEAVREIEHECCHDDNREQQGDVLHEPGTQAIVRMVVARVNVGSQSERKVNWDGLRSVSKWVAVPPLVFAAAPRSPRGGCAPHAIAPNCGPVALSGGPAVTAT